MIIQALGQRSVSVRSKGTMQQPTLSYLERTESTQQFHQGFPCCQTKTTMIHAAILFSIHQDSELPSGKFTLQCRQTPLNLIKGESSFKLVPKSIYHRSQIMLERKLIWKKKIIIYSQILLQNATGMRGRRIQLHRGPQSEVVTLDCQESKTCPVL